MCLSPCCVYLAALRRLRGCEVQKEELDEMLQEQAESEDRRAQQPWELFSDRTVHWQLISVAVISSAMQLCGNDSVSDAVILTYSFIFSDCFILVRVIVEPDFVQGTLGTRQESTQDGMTSHHTTFSSHL